MKTRLLVAIAFAALGTIIWWLAREHLSLERVVERERTLRAQIESQPLLAWAIGFVIYTLVSLFPGTSGKSIICGWLFGLWAGLAMVTMALTSAGCAGFLMSRYLLQDWLRTRLGESLDLVDRYVRAEGTFVMLTVRLMHVPYTLVNYSAGASSLALRTFAWTTLVGLIPSTMIFVGVGATLPTLTELLERGVRGVFRTELLAALILMGIAPLVVRWLIKQVHSARTPGAGNGS